jgi:hypothetical protein
MSNQITPQSITSLFMNMEPSDYCSLDFTDFLEEGGTYDFQVDNYIEYVAESMEEFVMNKFPESVLGDIIALNIDWHELASNRADSVISNYEAQWDVVSFHLPRPTYGRL